MHGQIFCNASVFWGILLMLVLCNTLACTLLAMEQNLFVSLQIVTLAITPVLLFLKKVQVGKDQEKAQSEEDSHSKNRGRKKQVNN